MCIWVGVWGLLQTQTIIWPQIVNDVMQFHWRHCAYPGIPVLPYCYCSCCRQMLYLTCAVLTKRQLYMTLVGLFRVTDAASWLFAVYLPILPNLAVLFIFVIPKKRKKAAPFAVKTVNSGDILNLSLNLWYLWYLYCPVATYFTAYPVCVYDHSSSWILNLLEEMNVIIAFW